jgi:Uma2 family endonuclease
MSSPAPSIAPDVSAIVTEDDTPVDNLYSEKQQRLLTSVLYASWQGPPPEEDGAPRRFLATANVGLFVSVHQSPLVPDVMVSADVEPHQEIWQKEHRSYFAWEFGKLPEVVIEVVSNREGGELDEKKKRYRKMQITHYIVWDPECMLSKTALHGFELAGNVYRVMRDIKIGPLGLGLVVWHGVFEGVVSDWLRWCDADGQLIPMAEERIQQEVARADQEKALRESAERENATLRAELERLRVK